MSKSIVLPDQRPAKDLPGQFPTTAPKGDSGTSSKTKKPRPHSGVELYRKWWVPYLWTAPAILGVVYFAIIPFVNTVALSFTDARPLGGVVHDVGVANYVDMFHDAGFWQATGNSILYALVAVPILVILPLLLAVLVLPKIPFIGFFRSVYYIPAVSSTVVVALAWQFLLKEDGPVNSVLLQMHLISGPIPFITNSWALTFSAIALTAWKGLGFYMVLYIAALSNIEGSLYEAARTDGAGSFRQFWHVTLPGTRRMMTLVGVLAAIGSLRVFSEIYILGGSTGGIGGANATLPFYIQDKGLSIGGNLGYGSAVSVFLFVLTLGLIVMSQRLSKTSED